MTPYNYFWHFYCYKLRVFFFFLGGIGEIKKNIKFRNHYFYLKRPTIFFLNVAIFFKEYKKCHKKCKVVRLLIGPLHCTPLPGAPFVSKSHVYDHPPFGARRNLLSGNLFLFFNSPSMYNISPLQSYFLILGDLSTWVLLSCSHQSEECFLYVGPVS